MPDLHRCTLKTFDAPQVSRSTPRGASINAAIGAPLPPARSSRWRLESEPTNARAHLERGAVHNVLVHRVVARVQGLARAWLGARGVPAAQNP